ncbi:polyketide synthase [Kibdelosporangium phytohabitans]|uniref:Polyketide synthase n=2 Tax=Kibdelosporangium phytohabitans TaxID=860235 RepID=A0A0N9IFR2_9PSEU|nr:class I SAM-dependent methyltransferase [Kibdelosporangium phytohabitans]ALG15306.1 polyketide synthase [Kibdelosporangium phytohabitans]
MLATLYGRALDSRRPNSVLNDVEAARAVTRIDYDFRKTKMEGTSAVGVAIRAKVLDDWTRSFLDTNPTATVLHLACGLDTRVQRVSPPDTVRWLDLDLPDVVALRTRLLDLPSGDYRLVGASVTSDSWLDDVPADRPTVAVFEGLSMYLHKQDGKRLIERITNRFPSGQLLFDCYGSLGIKLQKLVPAVRNAGATLRWGIDDPHEIETWHPGLTCLDALRSVDMPGLENLPLPGRVSLRVLARIPGLRDAGRILRYRF